MLSENNSIIFEKCPVCGNEGDGKTKLCIVCHNPLFNPCEGILEIHNCNVVKHLNPYKSDFCRICGLPTFYFNYRSWTELVTFFDELNESLAQNNSSSYDTIYKPVSEEDFMDCAYYRDSLEFLLTEEPSIIDDNCEDDEFNDIGCEEYENDNGASNNSEWEEDDKNDEYSIWHEIDDENKLNEYYVMQNGGIIDPFSISDDRFDYDDPDHISYLYDVDDVADEWFIDVEEDDDY